MKEKIWIQKRVFLSFSIFTIVILNFFAWSIYFFVKKNIEEKSQIIVIDKNIFWNSVLKIDSTKNLSDLEKFRVEFLKFLFVLNIFLVVLTFIFSFFITKKALRPLLDLSKFLDNYDFKNKKIFENFYWKSELWKLISSINKFILENKKIFESQINFIQDTSHELKTPLMQINSNLEILEWIIFDEKILNKLKEIWNSVKNIDEIISNLWFILRWEKELKQKKKINLWKYFENFLKKFENLAKKKNIEIVLQKNFDLEIENNEYYLDRLFWNLLSNAIFYNNWSWKIFVEIWKKFVKIKDQWIWIKKEEIEKIFDRFYRSQNSWLFYQDWSWLWLVIVKKICDFFGWKIEVSSEVWKGSEFKIVFYE